MTKLVFNPSQDYSIKEQSRLIIKDKIKNKYVVKKVIEPGESSELDISKYHPYWNYRFKFQIRGLDKTTGKERWIDVTKYKILYPETVNDDGMKYLLFEEVNSDKLIVVFQAINRHPSYNYVGTLSDFKINRLYIKDDYGLDKATKSSYYLGNNGDDSISIATQKLIECVSKELNIKKENTIFAGSSKGGFAALYHGYKFGAKYILPGGPQILLGKYLISGHEEKSIGNEIFKSIFGSISDATVTRSNNLFFEVLKNNKNTQTNTKIHVGYWEPHFNEHVVPFMEEARKLGIENISLDVADYNTHAELAKYYPQFLKEQLKSILSYD
ncbi:hypothetical protein [Salinicoccus sp. HZC-1]|uniref:hypothetical protein n=1 Tax=Salinicoccus sp. HZC-1 TaxID=3385497 RepID=UPI00398ADCF2